MPEEYTTLYRAFRPHRFCDVVGQGPIVQTLKNQVKSGRIAHAYLFNGTRGTGKTTTARILARAINCENPQDGEPCGVCPTCQALSQENNLDILEIDAASNGSVDQVRDLCAKVAYPPQTCRYRVIIIDEVHSLSTSAASFNALLKTLEEPPEHAVFILATTDPQKLPPTILSRCQRYDFKRIGTKDIAAQLSRICKEKDCQAEDEALLDIALLRADASKAGISEITQKNGALLFFFRPEGLEGAARACAAGRYKGRIFLSAGEKPYVTLKLRPTDDPLALAREVTDLYTGEKA